VLSVTSAGILLVPLFDILEKMTKPVNDGLNSALAGLGGYAQPAVLFSVLAIGLGMGLVGLASFTSRAGQPDGATVGGPSARRPALMIAAGNGLHNFSESLAIGQSAGGGQIAFAMLLILGFGLHNATEGFGITGPLTQEMPSRRFQGLLGLIGGGPTFPGTLVGFYFVSKLTLVFFLALAPGALIYVIGELSHANWVRGTPFQAAWGILTGLILNCVTEMVLSIAGA
jgi:ZIP family zinc transporter